MTEPLIRNIKVCGLTHRSTATLCAELGFGAVGFVFYTKSPRNISPDNTRQITRALPSTLAKVGVFVDEPLESMLATADLAGLTTIQLHGHEGLTIIQAIQNEGYHVVKVVRSADEAQVAMQTLPQKTSILLECGKGVLPGGNGVAWNWSVARTLPSTLPLGIAGGLSPDNITIAVEDSGLMAYDISSGVESAPSSKDPAAIRRLAATIQNIHINFHPFWR